MKEEKNKEEIIMKEHLLSSNMSHSAALRHGRSGYAFLILLMCLFTAIFSTVGGVDNDVAISSKSSSISNNNNNHPRQYSPFFSPTSGPIQDASCNVEQLEEANDSQLFTILHDLKNTEFFRNFAVDLDQRCPLENFGRVKKNSSTSSISSTSSTRSTSSSISSSSSFVTQTGLQGGLGKSIYDEPADDSDDDGKCASEGIPDLEPEFGQACGINSGSSPFSLDTSKSDTSSFGMNKAFDSNPAEPPGETESIESPERKISSDDEDLSDENDDGDDFECTGIPDEEDEELDMDEPLCSLKEEDFIQSPSGIREMLSSAFQSIQISISHCMGWESESQRNTFAWSNPSDPVIVTPSEEEPCNDENNGKDSTSNLLPDTFWMDICSNIKAGDGLKIVNLALNPERNTGYNGTHIWRAIYDKNCIDLDGHKSEPMCYEERVLYRLLSGLHASTTVSIAMNNKPPNKRKGRTNWEANPELFMEKFENNPEHIRNLHFSYVVLLRALKKASHVLYPYEIKTGNIVDDETATILLRRLLDSSILSSCNEVFTAFDESLMFQERNSQLDNDYVSLEENFKGVFHNISSILDCVQCQQCKLHGKMAMLGYGTALKILFLPKNKLTLSSLNRNEIVAFINTIAKMSESLKQVRELTSLYWSNRIQPESSKQFTTLPVITGASDPLDSAVAAISTLASSGAISDERESFLLELAMQRNEDLLLLAKYYSNDLTKFLKHSETFIGNSDVVTIKNEEPDAIVVGSGLAGLSATLNILDRGGKVLVIEKEHYLGGNSNKASSGINACCPNNETIDDYLESFKQDTIKSAGASARPDLVEVLVSKSAEAVAWLKDRVGVDLSLLAQLGGHKHKRTHRPSNGMAGAEIMTGIQKAVKKYQKSGMLQILVDTKVNSLIQDDEGRVKGVQVSYLDGDDDLERPHEFLSPNVMLATGGFASDRSSDSYLAKYRGELLNLPATAGAFSTGDGITIAQKLGAGTVDMDKVQIHPTGWVDPTDPNNPTKVLAAELMRGIGGMLINSSGKRFCNELGTRAYVTDKMLNHNSDYASSKKWSQDYDNLNFFLVISSSAASDGKKHVDHYVHKGLLTKYNGLNELSKWIGVNHSVMLETFQQYQRDADDGIDEWGKTSFQGLPQSDLASETYYAGLVTPVLHYCMGGITIDTGGHVVDVDGNTISGLYAAGEVSGGVHGDNRLGGNSLLECTVFGRIVGQSIPIKDRLKVTTATNLQTSKENLESREITYEELKMHNTSDDCWVAIHGIVYDLTDFADEHPAGAESIVSLAGKDGTEEFQAIHNENLLDDFDEERMGVLKVN